VKYEKDETLKITISHENKHYQIMIENSILLNKENIEHVLTDWFYRALYEIHDEIKLNQDILIEIRSILDELMGYVSNIHYISRFDIFDKLEKMRLVLNKKGLKHEKSSN